MADLTTKPGQITVSTFLETVDPKKKEDTLKLLELMQSITGMNPIMWGESMIGFGTYHYTYESGREGSWFLTGFAPRKQNFVIYIMPGFSNYQDLLNELGKYKTGKSCLYVNKLADINLHVLKHLVSKSVQDMKQKYKTGNST